MVGQNLLHYTVVERLGQGGMGVVYKGRDTHLDRFVALKVPPHDRVASDDARPGSSRKRNPPRRVLPAIVR